MFCPNCGTDLPDGAVFCGVCGATLNQAQAAPVAPPPPPIPPQQQFAPPAPQPFDPPPQQPFAPPAAPMAPMAPAAPVAPAAPAAPIGDQLKAKGGAALEKVKGMDSKKLLIIGGGAAAAILVLIIVISLLAGGGAKGTAKKWLNAHLTFDIAASMKYEYVDAKKWLDENGEYFEDELNTASVAKFVKDVQQEANDMAEELYGKNVKVKSLEIRSVDVLTNKKMNDMLDGYDDDDADVMKFNISKVTKIAKVRYKADVKGKDDSQSPSDTIYLAKAGGKWYVLENSLDMAYAVVFGSSMSNWLQYFS